MARSARTLAAWLGGLGLGSFLLVAYSHLETHVDRELRELPTHDRAALYRRTLETLRTTCKQARSDALLDHCRAQADFARRFPECDDACREITSAFTTIPTR